MKNKKIPNYKLPEYEAWTSMKKRCLGKWHHNYKNYGGRGITICDRWLYSFENFLKDVGKRPTSKHSLDRINNDGNYEPSNCRWATNYIQLNNRRNVHKFLYKGEYRTISELSSFTNICRRTLHARLITYKWPLEKALKQELLYENI